MKIFIAGAGGYLGTELTEYLVKKGYEVIALDRFYFGNTLNDLTVHKNLKVVKDDVRYFDKKLLKNVDVVINLASLSNDPSSDLNPKYTKQINYLGARRLAKLAKQMKVKKYIFASSCSVYGTGVDELTEDSPLSPVSEYAKSKISAEKALEKIASKNFKVLIFRLSTLFGVSTRRMRFDLILNIMTLHAWQNNKIYILGGGNQWRPLLHLSDAVKFFEKGINYDQKLNYEVFNVGSNNQNFQTIQVANEFKKYFPNLKIEIAPDDPDTRDYKVNFDKVKTMFKFIPQKDINEGIKELKRSLEKGEIEDGIKTSTHKYYKYLIDADEVLSSIKLKRRLF